MTSTSTTSPSSFSTAYCATEAPTLPAPTTVIFGRAMSIVLAGLQRLHVFDDRRPERRALDFLGALHESCEIVGHDLLRDGLFDPGDDPVGRFGPAQVAEHHLAREDDRAGVDLVLPGVLGRRTVRRLEECVAGVVVDVGARRDAEPADLGSRRVRNEVA